MDGGVAQGAPGARDEPCAACGKPRAACICDRVERQDTTLQVVILQHPREDDALLGTARLVTLTLPRARLRVGLSWPSLEQAVEMPGADPARWAVLAAARPDRKSVG